VKTIVLRESAVDDLDRIDALSMTHGQTKFAHGSVRLSHRLND